MSIYVIGDIQGCLKELKELLIKIKFSADKDIIWFTGDLVNRGPQSLETLRYVKSMDENAVTVLGNHDLHMLAIVYGLQKQRPSDTFNSILSARDKDNLMDWVAHQPLMHTANNDQHILVHAGIYPAWSITQAKQYANEVESALRDEQRIDFLSQMYGNQPNRWSDTLSGWNRLRFITNTFTRMRYCTADMALELKTSAAPNALPQYKAQDQKQNKDQTLTPWYTLRHDNAEQHIFFGHWSTLGLTSEHGTHCLDTGCLWGGTLSAMKIDKISDGENTVHQINCKGEINPF